MPVSALPVFPESLPQILPPNLLNWRMAREASNSV